MNRLILSVRHTGTRFTRKFLDHLEVPYEQIHSVKTELYRIDPLVNNGIIIPMRDPLLSWISHYVEGKKRAVDYMTQGFIESWDYLKEYEEKGEHIFLRLDSVNKIKALQDVADFYDSEISIEKFKWEGVGVTGEKPSDYEVWEQIRESLEGDGEVLLNRLAPYRERYGYGR